MKNVISILIAFFFSTVISAQTKYTIPVVVHVISPTTTKLLTEQEVKDGIKNINLQFKGLYAKMVKDKIITPHRSSIAAFDEIQFKLATRDTNNNVTTGITFTQNATWSNAGIAQEATFKKRKQWNPKRYMNIYIVDILNSGYQSGVAYRPSEIGTATRAYLDGVLIDDSIWPNTLPLRAPRWTDGFEGTMIHEIAHYLNLIHTMGEVNRSGTGCSDPIVVAGDGVDDTPKHFQDMFTISKDATEAQRTVKNCDDQIVMIDNFMCYSKTQRFFTAGQMQRMKDALNSTTAGRNNLWTTANLTLTGLAIDTTAPSVPTNLKASNVTTTSLTLKWHKTTDNQQVLGYDIYKNGVFLACTIDTTWAVTGLTTATTKFTVKARDFDNNLSGTSDTLTFPIIAKKSYCAASGKTAADTREWIKNVAFNTFNNNSTGNNYYQDFSTISTTVNKGSTYNLSVSVNAIWNATNDHNYIVAWIDWNNDSTFADTEKYVVTPQYLTALTATLAIKVPNTALLGKVRMRVRSVWNGTNTLTSSSACGSDTYGEVEDYSLTVAAAVLPVVAYCASSGNATGNPIEFVRNVKFNTLNNTSTNKTVFYEDFSSQTTSVQKGQVYPLIITLDSVWNANNDHDFVVTWIDWNNDKVFAANERYHSNKFVGPSKKDTVTITVPDSAVLGNVRMRVRSVWNESNTLTSSEACGSNLWGQVEDYTLDITALPALRAVASATETKAESQLKLTAYPNPTTGLIDVNTNTNKEVSICVFDALGRVILQKILTGSGQVDLSAQTKGFYFIKIREANGALKIVLQ